MRIRTAIIAAAVGALGLATPALALDNPVVADISPVGAGGAHGKATFFQIAGNVNVGVILDSDRSGAQGVDIRKGSCKSYAETPGATLVAVSGSDQQTKLSGAKLESLVGSVLLVHKAQETTSPVIGCAAIRG
jgi:hypothetical protein